MVVFMKVVGLIIIEMGKEDIYIKTVHIMKEVLNKENVIKLIKR